MCLLRRWNGEWLYLERIEAMQDRRHLVVHGMPSNIAPAGIEGDDPTLGLPTRFTRWYSEELDVAQINQIADTIADLNGELGRLLVDVWTAPR